MPTYSENDHNETDEKSHQQQKHVTFAKEWIVGDGAADAKQSQEDEHGATDDEHDRLSGLKGNARCRRILRKRGLPEL